MDGQCGKLVTAIGHQFITLTINICVQLGGLGARHCIARLSAAAETCIMGCSVVEMYNSQIANY